jgi:hypothetical protein
MQNSITHTPHISKHAIRIYMHTISPKEGQITPNTMMSPKYYARIIVLSYYMQQFYIDFVDVVIIVLVG